MEATIFGYVLCVIFGYVIGTWAWEGKVDKDLTADLAISKSNVEKCTEVLLERGGDIKRLEADLAASQGEKERRIYYQTICYNVALSIEGSLGGIRVGTTDEPSVELEQAVVRTKKRADEWKKEASGWRESAHKAEALNPTTEDG